ncbi:NAD-dependent epimerase [Tamilnaduibacter salinus]|uniref:NAD-dependent epimerase n=1 Tax=Tamilnaduibacter salinus TaxID=1484056 RepID=A0A2A2I0D2_9GAMM|nr:NAD-dependent epimerase/dehydratase family protein [Tamilnaduibacter salinus]PAV24605.1 NAD-dependent epimerase [Tamilnaduibacter salinus]
MAISTPRILMAGCGKLGTAIARELTDEARVFGLRRHPDDLPGPIIPFAANLKEPATLTGLPPDLSVVVYCLTPDAYTDEGYRDAFVNGLRNLLEALSDAREQPALLFVSSTGVYHQDDDSVVDETSGTRPERFSGQRVLEGEQQALDSGLPATVVRFSGIYGPSRGRFLENVRLGQIDPPRPGPYTNRIHEDDAARAAAHLVRQRLAGADVDGRFLASDDEPARLDAVVDWVRQQTHCADPAPDAKRGGRAGSKRCDNRRLRQSGFTFRYPSFRDGYQAMLG